MTGQFQGLEHDNRKGRSFFREATAYRYLLHEGVCATGVVPYCYGYTVIDPTPWKTSRKRDWLEVENLLVNLGCTMCPENHQVDDIRCLPDT